MTFAEVPTVRESVCSCGFPALKTDVPLGTRYTVDLDSVTYDYSMRCGGCGKKLRLQTIWAMKRGDRLGGYLPAELFELPSGPGNG